MQTDEKIIRITCRAADLLSVDSLLSFQGNLKSLSEKEYKKLRSSITALGFTFPVFVWRDGSNNFIIDGHQRLFVVKKMIDDGWILRENKLPVDWIEAESKKEAKEKVLLSASQYGRIDLESLYEYIETEQLDYNELEEIVDLPEINFEKFRQSFQNESLLESSEDKLTSNYLIVIQCSNEAEQKEAIDRLNLSRARVTFKEFLESNEQKKIG